MRHADLEPDGDTTLVIVGPADRRPRGQRPALKPGEAIRIFTGAAMPAGADTVFMQEDVTADGERVTVPKGLKLGANRRLAGEDVPAGPSCCRPAPCSRRSTSRWPPRSA